MNETKKRREWIKNAAIIFLAVLLVLTFFSGTIQNHSLPEVAVQYTTSDTVSSGVRVSGTVNASQSYSVTLDQTRTVRAVYVRNGDEVAAGDTLFELEDEDSQELTDARKQLKTLQEERNLTYLFISHDLSVVEHISDSIGVMYLGGLVETGATEDIFANPLHPYTQALFSAIPMPDPDLKRNRIILEGSIPSPANPPKGCKFHTRCSRCMECCKTEEPKAKDMGNGHVVKCHLYD